MKLDSYEEYKKLTHSLISEIPKHWDFTLLKRNYNVVLGKMLQPQRKHPTDQLLPYVRAANIQAKGVNDVDLKTMWFSPNEKVDLRLRQGDLLISEGGDVGRPAIWSSEFECYFQNSINRVRSRGKNNNKFLYYWILAVKSAGLIDVICNKSTISHFTAEKVQALPTPVPTPDEQTQIATFLDRETAKIDRLIEKQQRLIELLEEKRQAVISHAVTKGLNPDVPMKDSGVEWLGEVPEHWEVVPLKYLCSFSGGGTPSKENLEYWNGDIPWVSPKDMKTAEINDSKDKITQFAVNESSTSLVKAGAVLIVVRSGILQHSIPVAINRVSVALNQDMKALRFNQKLVPEFMINIIRGNQRSLLMVWGKQGATVESIEQEYLANTPVPVPAISEQNQILDELARLCLQIDQLTSKAKRAINLMKERRTALISAAVTGKIDVRDQVPQDVEEAVAS